MNTLHYYTNDLKEQHFKIKKKIQAVIIYQNDRKGFLNCLDQYIGGKLTSFK